MSNVVSMDKYKPHISGNCKCAFCGHDWVGVVPAGAVEFECPKCNRFGGFMRYGIFPKVGLECQCGCSVFTVSPDEVICFSCGQDTPLGDL